MTSSQNHPCSLGSRSDGIAPSFLTRQPYFFQRDSHADSRRSLLPPMKLLEDKTTSLALLVGSQEPWEAKRLSLPSAPVLSSCPQLSVPQTPLSWAPCLLSHMSDYVEGRLSHSPQSDYPEELGVGSQHPRELPGLLRLLQLLSPHVYPPLTGIASRCGMKKRQTMPLNCYLRARHSDLRLQGPGFRKARKSFCLIQNKVIVNQK